MASSQPIVDHAAIREWAETRGARPACVKGTGGKGDPGMIRLDFPGFSGGESLQEISWREWFRQFDRQNLALLVQERTSRGQKSNFNKLVSRESVDDGGRTGRRSRPRAARPSKTRSNAVAARTRRKATGASTRSRSGAGSRKSSAKKAAPATRKAARSTAAAGGGTGRRSSAASARKTSTRRATTTRAASTGRRGSGRQLTNHDEIRQWAETRGAKPACVRGTGGARDVGMIRLDFPGFSGADSLQEISWREWFRQFDENNLALIVRDKTARGGRSNFNKLVSRAFTPTRRAGSGRGEGAARRTGSAATRSGSARRRTSTR